MNKRTATKIAHAIAAEAIRRGTVDIYQYCPDLSDADFDRVMVGIDRITDTHEKRANYLKPDSKEFFR